jgi:hypothetical protein
MSSRAPSPLEVDSMAYQASASTSGTPLPNAFGLIMALNQSSASTLVRDQCSRPEPVYNNRYNLYKPPSINIDEEYSPYVYGEPLFDDRPVIVAYLPRQHTIASATKRPKTSWV